MAIVLAIQSLCCCPPESEVPGCCNLSFTSFQSPDLISESSTNSSQSLPFFTIQCFSGA